MARLQRHVGDTVGGYRVLERLGSGGSGSVYKVADGAGGVAALKIVDAKDDEVAAARLEREVRALRSLRHPAVPHILDAELSDAETFVVFEFVEGETLFDHIQRHGPMAGDALANFAERTASALEAVHAAGVIHRDVTPSNVMVGVDGPVLIDFGLAHRAEDSRLTREGMVSGTPGYVAPEVIDGAEPGAQADRWSWAATVAYAMTAQAPFGSGTGAISRTLEADVRLPDVPGAAALRAALGRDLNARPGMRDVVAALRGATEVMPTGPAPTAVAPLGLAPGTREDGTAATTVLPSGEQRLDGDAGLRRDDAPVGHGDHGHHYPWEPGGEGTVRDGGAHDLDSDSDPNLHFDPESESEEAEWDGPARVPRRRFLLVLAALVVIVAAPLAPVMAYLVMVAVAIVARGVFRRALAIEAASARRGQRRTSDAVVHTLGLPWHTLRAAAESVPAALTAAAMGGGATAGAWWLVSAGTVVGTTATAQYFGHAGALGLGGLVAAVVMGFGPFMSGTREGAHRLAAAVSRTSGLHAAWVLVALVAILVGGIGIYVQLDPLWWPLPDLPAATP